MNLKRPSAAYAVFFATTGYAVFSVPALAQQASVAADDTQAGPEEIVVTAQRRSERLQDVPIAITVVGSEQLERAGVTDVQDLGTVAPSLNITRFGGAASLRIRGVGSSIISEGQENSVSIYVNGVLQQSAEAALFSLSNIERVEVLKGPQGTLFGRNSTGGVVSVTTKAPSQIPAADISLSYGNFGTIEAGAYGTIGVTPNLATDIAFHSLDQDKGWGTNIFNGKDIFQRNSFIVRNQWAWTPGSSTEITLAGSYFDNFEENRAVRPAQGTSTLGGNGFPGFYNINSNSPAFVKRKGYDFSLNAKHDIGWATLINIFGYSYVDAQTPADPDASPFDFASLDRQSTLNKGYSEELQIQSNPDSSIFGFPITWIAGFYYLHTYAGYVPNPAIILTGTNYGAFAPVAITGVLRTNSYSGFGQTTITVLPNTHLTGGVRYTSDKRILDNQTIYKFPLLPLAENHQEGTFNKFTYKFTLDHRFSDDLMIYGTHSTGFKAGTFNLVDFGAPSVKPELLKAYEIGTKMSLPDGRIRLDISAYHYDYNNIQAQVYSAGATGIVQLINAAKAKINGIDIDFTAVPIENLNIRAGLAYTDAKYKSFPTATFYAPLPGGGTIQRVGDAAGNNIINTPKFGFNVGADYEFIMATGKFVLSTQYSHQSKFYWDFENSFEAAPRDILNASVELELDSGLSFRIWGRNLLKDRYADQGQISAFGYLEAPGAPRTYGVELGAHF
ncbi:TonB-dependent receptor [Sphingopyxis macrogoltabida]|nr:TonB-dependent receptor [Sphingopyxis macrogoltabida]ALJ16384.1 hypothetical protein LH19_26655 [Sphingopyxis macrogoltabida]